MTVMALSYVFGYAPVQKAAAHQDGGALHHGKAHQDGEALHHGGALHHGKAQNGKAVVSRDVSFSWYLLFIEKGGTVYGVAVHGPTPSA